MSWTYRPFILASLVLQIFSHPYDSKLANYNININQAGGNKILSYSSDWPEKSTRGGLHAESNKLEGTSHIHCAPRQVSSSRKVGTFRTLALLQTDHSRIRFVDGDPTNNDYFNTQWEWDSKANR
ncbi:Cell wall alpha-1,3-glucan synthase ags1 [Puccinia graminis f. sp. tritici]|uniref:Cell wall alpha-1,3-glucan synthase ags1 n=1 Tax=Puccinia graminis f. sp. tritici TaxID=56615 RepID=A0A5B0M5Q0_PUCGR|nr:Cell wall alpha-1,3-glucan synthase ags1 [Puccinia graminis f. sp. tritici]